MLAAAPISTTDSSRPMIRMVGWSLAAPATASTLSSDIETSATTICQIAAPSVLVCAASAGPRVERLVGRHLVPAVRAQLAVHLPADPQQQDAAGQRQADDGEQLGGDQREEDAQHDGGADAPEDDLAALLHRHGGRGHADHDGVVAGQHKVDRDDLPQSRELGP